MIYRKLSAKRQVHLGKAILEHLGVEPGDKIDCEISPDGTVTIKAHVNELIPDTKDNQ